MSWKEHEGRKIITFFAGTNYEWAYCRVRYDPKTGDLVENDHCGAFCDCCYKWTDDPVLPLDSRYRRLCAACVDACKKVGEEL